MLFRSADLILVHEDLGIGERLQLPGVISMLAAEKLLPLLQDQVANVLRVYDETRANVRNTGYDLRPEAMKTVTVCIIRTDLQ